MSDWTEERVRLLREYHALGLSGTKIARIFHTTRNAILGKVWRLGMSCPRENPFSPYLAGDPSRPKKRRRKRPAKVEARTPVAAPPPTFSLPPPSFASTEKLLTVMELGWGHCRYPHGDPGTEGFGFCGAWTGGKESYCEKHKKLCSHPSLFVLRAPRAF